MESAATERKKSNEVDMLAETHMITLFF